jgi:outer membrane protein assembly factor BamB
MKPVSFIRLASCVGGLIAAQPAAVHGQVSVTTYHYDNSRTGWNNQEPTLTPAKVSTFRILHTVTLDDLVDAQPLVIACSQTTIARCKATTDDVVYVATENNTVYAIDASSGQIVLSRNLGPAVSTPSGCNITPRVGITGTPVIDAATHTLYAIAYTVINGIATYQLHALDLSTFGGQGGASYARCIAHFDGRVR